MKWYNAKNAIIAGSLLLIDISLNNLSVFVLNRIASFNRFVDKKHSTLFA